MARIELRDTKIRFKDGYAATADVDQTTTPPADGETTMTIDNVVGNGDLGDDVIPVGAQFTFPSDTEQVYTVTARTPSDGSAVTTDITFTPALDTARGLPADDETLTFTAQLIEIKVGEGNLTYTESNEFEYELDRGNLDSVREGDEQPMEVNLDFVYEHITTGTGEDITPIDALKSKGGASEWVSSSSDACEPYAIDVEVEHTPKCGGGQIETSVFPDFRFDSLNPDLGEASISVQGRCNASEPTVTREDQ